MAYYQNTSAGQGQYPPQGQGPNYGQQQGYQVPPPQQAFHGQQPSYGNEYQQPPQYNSQANGYGPPSAQHSAFSHQPPYHQQGYNDRPWTHNAQPPAYNSPPPGYNSPAPTYNNPTPNYYNTTSAPSAYNAPQKIYQGGPPPPIDANAERGWKTNVTVAGGAALAGGALLHHYHQQFSSPPPQGGKPAGFFSKPSGHGHQHPLARIADPQKPSICLTLVDEGEDGSGKSWDKYVLRHDTNAGAVYRVQYTDDGTKGKVFRGPVLGGKSEVVGSWKTHWDKTISFEFPKSARRDSKEKRKWDGWRPDKADWASDIGMLDERWLKWNFMDEAHRDGEVRFTLQCVDVDDAEKTVVSQVSMETFYEGNVSIPLKAVQDEEQFDEMAVVTFATLDWWRDRLQ